MDYDLEERTAKFGEDVIKFAKTIDRNVITVPLISQLIRSSTSIGANYSEADNAESKRDFVHKISICKKESREAKYWLRMVATACPNLKKDIADLWKEAKELNLIFNRIVISTKKNMEQND